MNMDNKIFGLIKMPTTIKIKRSDGRIHLAKVVQLNLESKSVGVEWTENNDVKGKEILLDLVYELNPELRLTDDETLLSQPSVIQQQTTVRPTAAVQPLEDITHDRMTRKLANNNISKITSDKNDAQTRLTLDIDTFEREYSIRPPPTLPPQLLQIKNNAQSSTSVPTTSSILNKPQPSTIAVRSIRRPQMNSTVSQIKPISSATTTSSSLASTPTNPAPPSPAPDPIVQPINRTNNKQPNERRLSRLHVVQPATVIEQQTMHSTVGYNGPLGQMILDYRSTLSYTPITSLEYIEKDLRICVCVRKRPINKKEIARKDNDVITIPNKDHCLVHVPKTKVDLTKLLDNQTFRFDFAFDEKSTNELVYRYTAQPLIETVFNGGNATVFAYGQTGSGKTFTMGCDLSCKTADFSHGIYAQTTRDIFQRYEKRFKQQIDIYCTFYEIYCGKVYDLLNNKKRLRVLEDQKGLVQICDRKEQHVKNVQDVLTIIQHGMNIRTSGQTAANINSSRSHAVLQIILKASQPTTSITKNGQCKRYIKEIGKMSLIDLAGSERGKDTASGDRLQRMEGSEINKSLLALKECIRALGRGDGHHVPFRGSTLTKVLRDSFIGEKSKVCMIAMISPSNSDVENTMNTLRYADRVKELRMDDIKTKNGNNDEQTDELNSADDKENGFDNDEDNDYVDTELDEAMQSYTNAIEHLQEYEEEVFDCCQDVLKSDDLNKNDLRNIYEQTMHGDYDQEKFVQQLKQHVEKRQQQLNDLQVKIEQFEQYLTQEECSSQHLINKKIKNKNREIT
ncbi:unnamed protein product [Didymodactylos carnosus]|uniref:Kinesin-like protein n=1 Tax=Didymodactylos carnosus TaxID=1234261 RepID=A0A814LU65_9BILA|nr:unnamed protein product [Didymodactylos carnosus]CAF1120345.1 unnamed protein product [Didymodactylos carnosus]CAF3837317.1 unnamed protein product [Didymodactylos carnosus]CAF3893794.1 unnamed protein product [Didymodactylos carnosus]